MMYLLWLLVALLPLLATTLFVGVSEDWKEWMKKRICDYLPVNIPAGASLSCPNADADGGRTCKLICPAGTQSSASSVTCDGLLGWTAMPTCVSAYSRKKFFGCSGSTSSLIGISENIPISGKLQSKTTKLNCHLTHCASISSKGYAQTFGSANDYQLGGIPETTTIFDFSGTVLFEVPIIDIKASNKKTFVLTATGELYGMGYNTMNELFILASTDPVTVPTKSDYTFPVALTSGAIVPTEYSTVVAAEGRYFGVGRNTEEQLASPASVPLAPFELTLPGTPSSFVLGFHSWGFIDVDGTVWLRGYSYGGTLPALRNDWTQLVFDSGVVGFVKTFSGAAALLDDGRVYVMGSKMLTGVDGGTGTPQDVTSVLSDFSEAPITGLGRGRRSIFFISETNLVTRLSETAATNCNATEDVFINQYTSEFGEKITNAVGDYYTIYWSVENV